MAVLDRLKLLLPTGSTTSDGTLSELLGQVSDFILNYTHLSTLPEQLVSLQVKMALISYNRMGSEGESERREGEVALVFSEIPAWCLIELKQFRIAIVPVTYATV